MFYVIRSDDRSCALRMRFNPRSLSSSDRYNGDSGRRVITAVVVWGSASVRIPAAARLSKNGVCMATASKPAAIDLVAARNAAMQCCNAIEGVRIAAAVSKHQSLPFNTDSIARLGQAADAGRWLIQASPRLLLLASSGPVRTMSGFSPTAHQAAFDLARSMWLTVREAICCQSIACGEGFYDGEGDGFALAAEKVQRFSAAIVEAVVADKLPDALEIRAAVVLEAAKAEDLLSTASPEKPVAEDVTMPTSLARRNDAYLAEFEAGLSDGRWRSAAQYARTIRRDDGSMRVWLGDARRRRKSKKRNA